LIWFLQFTLRIKSMSYFVWIWFFHFSGVV
jgi:hypothetical protein